MQIFKKFFIPSVILLSLVFPLFSFAEPLQNDLFVVMKPNGVLGKSPLYPTFKVADSSDPFASKIYEAAKSDPKYKEVLLRYQKAQTDTMRRYKKRLIAEGKSQQEIDKLLSAKADPIYLIIKDGKATPYMQSGSAFIQTYKNGKLVTDFHYVCPKVSIFNQWEGFQSKPTDPFSESERKEYLNLVSHETSHAIMKEFYGFIPKGINPLAALGHWEGKMSTPQLAFTEGYAEFMGAWYSGSEDYDAPQFSKDIENGMPKTRSENKKTEGVVACLLWDIAKGDGGIKNGIDKIHQVLREKKPWTIEGFYKGFKTMFPGDAAAIDAIVNQNMVPTADSLFTCYYNLKSSRKTIERLGEGYNALSWFKNPIKKIKSWWSLRKAKSTYTKMLDRYQTMYGYDKAVLTSPNPPKVSRETTTEPAKQPQSQVSAKVVTPAPVKAAFSSLAEAQKEYDAAYKAYTDLALQGSANESVSAAADRMKKAKTKLESLKSQSK